jgi:nicotinamide-nucleotide adenylyltransferase
LAIWEQRYASARAALLDVGHLLDLRARLAQSASSAPQPVTFLAGAASLRRARRVTVFAGSFNPLTVAHVAAAEAARAALQLEAFVWAFSRVTVDKERVERASLVDRAVQLDAYIQHAAPDDTLAAVDAGLYADQAEAFRALLSPGADLYLLVGFDKVVQIFDARYYTDREAALRRLFAVAALLVTPRAGQDQTDLRALLAAPENQPYADHVRYLPLPPALAAVSSTAARAACATASHTDKVALATLLAPEGVALALTTNAYASPETLAGGETIDRYALRTDWLDALAATPAAARPAADLAPLIERSAAPTPEGATLRRWLRGARWPGAPTTLSDLLAHLA